tara:strand:- start:16974 stop:18650 length:1677 start_codon:yes stop_codon:yes gene_type:complete
MAKIISKADLNVGTELTVDTTTRTITLNVAGNLVAKDGVTWQALYSKLIQLWETGSYNEFPFPVYAIDALSGQFNIGFDGTRYNTWKFGDTLSTGTRLYLRDGGWNEYAATTPSADGTAVAGTIAATFAGIVSLGTVSSGAQLYYQKVSGAAPIDFTYTDAANLGVQVFGDAANGNFTSNTYLQGFVRVYGKRYTSSVLADTGKTGTGSFLVNLLLSNSDDLDSTGVYADIITTPVAPYTKMRINYFPTAFVRDVDVTGTQRSFGIVVDNGTHSGVDGAVAGGTTITSAVGGITGANFTGGTVEIHNTGTAKGVYTIVGTPTATVVTVAETITGTISNLSFTIKPTVASTATLRQIYSFVQAKLIQPTTINDVSGGTSVIGKTASLLLNWTAKLVAGVFAPINLAGGGSGVSIEGLADADINTVQLYDNSAILREYGVVSAGNLNFSTNLVGGWYALYYSDLTGTNDWGTATAVIVRDKTNTDIAGTIATTIIPFNYDFTNQIEGGLRTGGTNTAVTLVAGNSGSAKPVVVATTALGGLIDSKAISITATAETDRAYA